MLLRLLIANLKMIARDRQALFWALVFPLIFVVVFGLFRLDQPPTLHIGIVDHAQDSLSRALVQNLGQIGTFDTKEWEDEAKARQDVKDGKLDYLLIFPEGMAARMTESPPATITLVYDRTIITSAAVVAAIQRFLDQVNMNLAHAPSLLALDEQGVQSRQLSYFDFLLPGFVGMGVMTFSIIGVASTMALYREKKILRRILATPLPVRTFFAAHVLAQLFLSLAQAAIILAAGILLFGGTVVGNYLYIALLVLLGNLAFLNLGFLVGAIAKTVNAANGLGNAVTVPMMFFSGVFFPTEELPKVLAVAVRYLPLSPMLKALRGVALEARPFWDFPQELAILGAWIVVTSFLAARFFHFDR
ncbi:MAG: ABC transporter permease [Chloroflexi bacterium]|nr:ABC transporter permease [Chloroflexota bacterium]